MLGVHRGSHHIPLRTYPLAKIMEMDDRYRALLDEIDEHFCDQIQSNNGIGLLHPHHVHSAMEAKAGCMLLHTLKTITIRQLAA